MQQQKSEPVDWVGKEFTGFVINTTFSEDNTNKIMEWLAGLKKTVKEGIYTMTPESLHITVLDWVAPLYEYNGADKRALYEELRPTYDAAFRRITKSVPAFDVHFNDIRVTPGAIILIGQDNGQFQSIRGRFMQSIVLPEGGKQPPDLVHASLARFVPPAIDLAPVRAYAAKNPLDILQPVASFRLLETRREPTQEFTVLDTYQLGV